MFFNPSLTPLPPSVNWLVLSTSIGSAIPWNTLIQQDRAVSLWGVSFASPTWSRKHCRGPTTGHRGTPWDTVGRLHRKMCLCLKTVQFRRSSIKQWLWSVTSPPTEGFTGPQAHQAPSSLSILQVSSHMVATTSCDTCRATMGFYSLCPVWSALVSLH